MMNASDVPSDVSLHPRIVLALVPDRNRHQVRMRNGNRVDEHLVQQIPIQPSHFVRAFIGAVFELVQFRGA